MGERFLIDSSEIRACMIDGNFRSILGDFSCVRLAVLLIDRRSSAIWRVRCLFAANQIVEPRVVISWIVHFL
jgi:hypothetical protein